MLAKDLNTAQEVRTTPTATIRYENYGGHTSRMQLTFRHAPGSRLQ